MKSSEPIERHTRKPEEAAVMIGVGRNAVYEMARTGQLRSIRVGRKVLIPLSAIEEFLNGHRGAN